VIVKNSPYNWDEIIRGMNARLESPTADEYDELEVVGGGS
jgi:hypothetical protein